MCPLVWPALYTLEVALRLLRAGGLCPRQESPRPGCHTGLPFKLWRRHWHKLNGASRALVPIRLGWAAGSCRCDEPGPPAPGAGPGRSVTRRLPASSPPMKCHEPPRRAARNAAVGRATNLNRSPHGEARGPGPSIKFPAGPGGGATGAFTTRARSGDRLPGIDRGTVLVRFRYQYSHGNTHAPADLTCTKVT